MVLSKRELKELIIRLVVVKIRQNQHLGRDFGIIVRDNDGISWADFEGESVKSELLLLLS